jgi:hypothetical protein
VGLLGADYPGYCGPGDAAGLARLLTRAEADPAFLAELAARGRQLAGLFAPAREREAWRALLAELAGGRSLDRPQGGQHSGVG